MESYTSMHPQQTGLVRPTLGRTTIALALAIALVTAAGAVAESQIAELEPGPYSYQHAQLMTDVQYTRSFGERKPPATARITVRDGELSDLCRDLDSLQEQIRRTERRLDELNRETGPWPEQTTEVTIRSQPMVEVEVEIDDLSRQRQRLTERAGQQTMELRELRIHLSNREREIASELQGIHEQIQDIERHLVGLDRRRQEHLERLVAAQNQIQQLEERLRDLMAEVARMRWNVGERIGQNHRQQEVIHGAIEQTQREAQQVRDQIEEIRRTSVSVSESTRGSRRIRTTSYSTPAPIAAPADPKVEVEIKLLREEVVQLRHQLQEAPRRVEVVYIENPYAVGSARGYYWPCR